MGKVGSSIPFPEIKDYRIEGNMNYPDSFQVQYDATAKHDGLVFITLSNSSSSPGTSKYGTSRNQIFLDGKIISESSGSYPEKGEPRFFGSSVSAAIFVNAGETITMITQNTSLSSIYTATVVSLAGDLDFVKSFKI